MEFEKSEFVGYDIQHPQKPSPELGVGLQEVEWSQTPDHPAGMLINPEHVPASSAKKPTTH